MNQSESIKNLAAALAKTQAKLQSAELNAKNPFFKSNYADLGSVVKACRSLMAENGLSIAQYPGRTNSIIVETVDQEGNQVHHTQYIMEITSVLMHESGEWQAMTLSMPLAKPDPQGYGSAVTYARRYALQSILGVVTGDDDDGNRATGNNGSHREPIQPVSPKMPTAAQKKAFHATGVSVYGDAWDDKRPELVGAVTHGRTTSSNELNYDEMSKLIDGMTAKAS